MSVRDRLSQVIAGVDGALAATVVGMDGTVVEVLQVDPAFSIDAVARDCVTALKILYVMSRKADGGPMEYTLVTTEHLNVVAAMAGIDYGLAVALTSKGNLGKLRLQLRRYLPEITELLNAKVL